jgi:hypothetical protein
MVGLGETDDEIRWLMDDLVAARVDIMTIGQYLRPTLEHHDIIRFVTPERFEDYKAWGKEAGFAYVASGPYVRSSYVAEEVLSGALSLADLAKGGLGQVGLMKADLAKGGLGQVGLTKADLTRAGKAPSAGPESRN